MADPTTVNQAATIVNQVIYGAIRVEDDALEAATIAEVPWLGLPIVKQIFEFVLHNLSDRIYREAAMAATKLVVDYQVNREESSVVNDFDNLQMAIASGDEVAIHKASTNLDNSYGSLIHSDGSATP